MTDAQPIADRKGRRSPKILVAALVILLLALVAVPQSSHAAALVLFWSSVALLAYAAVIYPLAIAAWAALRPRPCRREPIEPAVSIVISAHNEIAHIGRKLGNLLEIDYPADRLEILLGCDGSTDGTLERLRRVTEQHIRVLILPERQGKPAVLNKLIPKAAGEIVVLADVRQSFDPQILRKLVQAFADPKVGAVSGELMISRDGSCSTVGEGAGAYWKYEKFIRSGESRIDSTIGATGAIYAIRKELFEPIPEDTVLDDVLIPLRIARLGYRVLFESSARACDLPSDTARQEFTRKVRTLAGNFQLFSREKWLLRPSQNRLWWQTISHKGLRLLFPLLQVTALAANIALIRTSTFYKITLLLQLLFYAGAIAGHALQQSQKKFAPATFPYTFCLLSWATVVGFVRSASGSQNAMWQKSTLAIIAAMLLLGSPQAIAARITQRGTAIRVQAGGDFQHALDRAKPGDVIFLDAGATYVGTFVLPAKSGSGPIVIRTSASDSSLPRPGQRIDPSYSAMLPKLVAPDEKPALRAAPGAHHFRLMGIEVRPAPNAFAFNLIELGVAATTEGELPHHLTFDRCYIHGDPVRGSRRGIAMNGKWIAVVDSYLSDFKDTRSDSQALGAWNGSGPFQIINNYLEAAGENVLFGGADPQIPQLVPSDIEIRRNHFFKPLTWRVSHPTYAGTPWAVKNLFELKNARRVLIEGNLFENNWEHQQNGFAILFTPRNQGGSAPWSVVEDVMFTHNIVRHSGSAINILGYDDNYPSQQTRRILIANNLFEDIDGSRWGGAGRLIQLVNATADVVVDHNTAFHSGDVIATDHAQVGFAYTNNLTAHNQYGVAGSGTFGDPLLTLSTYFPGVLFTRNVLAGGNRLAYPAGNFFPPSMSEVLFIDPTAGNYRLQPISPYKNAGTDGKDVGIDVDALLTSHDSDFRRRFQGE